MNKKMKWLSLGMCVLLVAVLLTAVDSQLNGNDRQINSVAFNSTALLDNTVTFSTMDDPYEIYEGQHLKITITGYWDPPQPERIICMWVNIETLPEGATFTPECHCDYGEVTSVFEWTPAIGQAGTYVVIFYLGETCGEPLGTFSITIIVYPADLEPPEVVIESPPDGSTFAEPCNITLIGHITDNAGIISIGSHHIWEDGETWDSSTVDPPQTYYLLEWIFPLYGGTNIITIFAYDGAGNYGESTVVYKVEPCAIDLTIYDGLEGTGGGNIVPESEEETRGAFTVTNIQDTNGDGIRDKDQNPVKATPKGRDEVDLMKMVLHPPTGPNCGPNSFVHLVKSGPNSGQVKLWDSKTKNNEIPPTNPPDIWVYKVSQLPKTVWVEIRENPLNLVMRGITFTYSTNCCPKTDVLKATGIWSEVTDVKHDNTDAWNNAVWPDMPANVRAFIDEAGGFGLRRYQNATNAWWYGNVITIQFTVYPPGIGDEEGVYFDITRQIHFRDQFVPPGANLPNYATGENWPNHVEQPNDDTHNGDESDKPSNKNHMYVEDKPRFPESGWGNNILFIDSSNNFMEFMRVRLDGTKPSGETVQGSRCSPYYPWHAAIWLSRDWGNPGQVIRRFVGPGRAEIHPINCVEPGHILILDFNPPWNIP
ncbi:MAG: hypothetical protein U9O96_06860 [Candidatus Thermoplasmatota archaeon]|nr:hypothetical protein [Candidatus Thermoplasmatota archaeon]